MSDLVSYVGGKVYAYREELDVLKDPHLNASAMAGYGVAIEPEMLLRDGEKLEIAGFVFRVIYTPGHTKGGCCYYEEKEKALFSGDTIFMESIGRTDLPTGNTAQLLDSGGIKCLCCRMMLKFIRDMGRKQRLPMRRQTIHMHRGFMYDYF